MKRAIVWLLILAAVGAGGYYGYDWYSTRSTPAPTYRTQPLRTTDIAQTISATGTLVPEDVIDVGAQVNGQIAEFGKDTDGKPIDYRSVVQEGMLLAKIDDALYAADLASSKAQKAQAQSQVVQAEAQIKTGEANKRLAEARAEQTRRDFERAKKLQGTTALSQADYDAAESAYDQAKASVGVADAAIAQAIASKTQAEAQVQQADASVQRTSRNVVYCVIKSPVSGVIIDKRVEIGQTVVASLNAPSLFLIAKDLSKMQVLVQVNEADIGNVRPGQKVAFGVDAFSGKRFKGEVRKVRLNATMTQNVVTYTVEIATDNADLLLLPYLTANVKFDVAHRDNVLAAPNSALRWTPKGVDAPEQSVRGKTGENSGMKPGTLWVLKEGKPQMLAVKAGLSDGVVTEVQGDGVTEGLEVIVGEQTQQAAGTATTNPFAPPRFGTRPRTTGESGSGSGRGGAGGAGR
jgi:HlyD family secretion protein